jgi:hypothetical protein
VPGVHKKIEATGNSLCGFFKNWLPCASFTTLFSGDTMVKDRAKNGGKNRGDDLGTRKEEA